jgi:hypothetical protein
MFVGEPLPGLTLGGVRHGKTIRIKRGSEVV